MSSIQINIPFIGLTGGIGSGKSTVSQIMSNNGGYVLSADDISKEILFTDQIVIKQVMNVFGMDVVDENGKIIKSELAKSAFKNSDSIQKLNKILHPKVISKIKLIAENKSKENKYKFIVAEAALIYEAGFSEIFDQILVIAADSQLKIDRIAKRDNSEIEDITKRMNLQIPQEIKIKKADKVIYNNKNVDNLKSQVELYIKDLLEQK